MIYYSRERNSKEDIITESSKTLNFLYGNFIGRLVLKLFTTKLMANLIACYMNSKLSIKRIDKFVNKNNINTFEYETKLKVFFALPCLNDRQDNLVPINKLVDKMKL